MSDLRIRQQVRWAPEHNHPDIRTGTIERIDDGSGVVWVRWGDRENLMAVAADWLEPEPATQGVD